MVQTTFHPAKRLSSKFLRVKSQLGKIPSTILSILEPEKFYYYFYIYFYNKCLLEYLVATCVDDIGISTRVAGVGQAWERRCPKG